METDPPAPASSGDGQAEGAKAGEAMEDDAGAKAEVEVKAEEGKEKDGGAPAQPPAPEYKYPEFPDPCDEREDVDSELCSEFFDTRQQFLNLCQGNHYQFDQLRRAKHSSMMALYHIHNPDIPKFLTSCTACGLDINAGMRFDCNKCPDFHLCEKCYRHYRAHGQNPHEHHLQRVAVLAENSGHQLTEEERRKRKRTIQLHMQLLAHASSCRNAACPSANCEKMKNLLAHGGKCTIKVQGGCAVCRRIWALLQIHARQCHRPTCLVQKCRQLKEQLRNLELQQNAMDERRRLAMNQQYNPGAASRAAATEDK